MVSVSEQHLVQAYNLAARQGIFVEPTACLPLAALRDDKIELVEPVVSILTGSGLKMNIISN
jgi:threonine synthase